MSTEEAKDVHDCDWLSKSLERLCAAPKPTSPSKPTSYDTDAGQQFKIVTWNIWFSPYQWKMRLEAAIHQTLDQDPDVFCFQEVTTDVHSCMIRCRFLRERYDPTEEQLPHGYDCAIWVKKQVNLSCLQTRDWICSSIPLPSIYGRRGLCVDLNLENTNYNRDRGDGSKNIRIRVITTHLESGKIFAETRKRQLDALFTHIKKCPHKDNAPIDASFLVGDFNLDPTYSENELVDANGIDMWKKLKPNDVGFTEDTYKNEMRYIAHGKHKQVRYDRVVLIPSTTTDNSSSTFSVHPQSIELLGTAPLDRGEEVWVSDHFGLVAQVGFFSGNKKARKVGPGEGKLDEGKNVVEINDGYTTP